MNLYNLYSKPKELDLYAELGSRMDDDGVLRWRNAQGQVHRDGDKPAVIWDDGTKKWYQNGKLHRVDGPAVIQADGTQEWLQKGQRHRDGDKPAIIYANGRQDWYKDGLHHRDDGPAIIYADGSQSWYQKGERHRDDGPASIFGDVYDWYKKGTYIPTDKVPPEEMAAWQKKKRLGKADEPI